MSSERNAFRDRDQRRQPNVVAGEFVSRLYNVDAEKAVLGSMLAKSELVIPKIQGVLSASDFFVPVHQLWFEVFLQMFAAGQPIDITTADDFMRLRGESDYSVSASPGILAELAAGLVTHLNIDPYCRIVRDYSLRRMVYEKLRESARALAEGELDLSTLLNQQMEIGKLVQLRQNDQFFATSMQAIDSMLDQLRKAMESENEMLGIPFGYPILDEWTGGMMGGDVIALGALSGVGKTALALNVIQGVCSTSSKWRARKSGFFSTEMSKEALLKRIAAMVAQVDAGKLRRRLEGYDYTKIETMMRSVKEWPLLIDDTKRLTLSEFVRRVRQMVLTDHVELVVVDYLQNISKDSEDTDDYVHYRKCSQAIDELAAALGIPIIVLVQLNRAAIAVKEPTRHHIEGGSKIAQDADIVILLHSPHVEGVSYADSGGLYDYTFIVDKNREGRTGRIKFKYRAKYLQFHEVTKDDQDFSTKGKA